MRKLAIVDRNPLARHSQWRAAPDPKKFFYKSATLIHDLASYKPDVVFINKGHVFKTLKEAVRKFKSVYFYGDWYTPLPAYVMQNALFCDAVIFTNKDPELWRQLRRAGQKNVHFVSQGADIEVFKPLENEPKKYDLVFPANYLGPKFCGSDLRMTFVRNLFEKGYDLKVVGNGWPADINAMPRQGMIELNKTLNQAKMSVGISHFINVPFYTSNRIYQCMATGTPHITWTFPGIDTIFRNASYLSVQSYDRLYETIDVLLNRPDFRRIFGALQSEEIKCHHTIFDTWKNIEKILKTLYN